MRHLEHVKLLVRRRSKRSESQTGQCFVQKLGPHSHCHVTEEL